MQIFLGKNAFLYKKSAFLQHLANVTSGELLHRVRFCQKIEHGARRRPKVLLFDKWRALARIHDQIKMQKSAKIMHFFAIIG